MQMYNIKQAHDHGLQVYYILRQQLEGLKSLIKGEILSSSLHVRNLSSFFYSLAEHECCFFFSLLANACMHPSRVEKLIYIQARIMKRDRKIIQLTNW